MATNECMFIAGDPSGDKHAAPILRELKRRSPELKLTGIGGPHMKAEGFKQLLPFEPFNKMGFVEVVLHLPFFLRAKKLCINYLRDKNPSCLVCVDYSGFNIPMMKAAAALGIPVVWYIAPMVWAWKKRRAEVLGRYATHICCIFPFEVPYFQPFTKNVHFVGNPVVEDREQGGTVPDRSVSPRGDVSIAFVPGSRLQEVTRLLPEMVAAYKKLKSGLPHCRGTVSRHPSLSEELFASMIAGTDLEISTLPLSELYTHNTLAVVTSGTATLEAALAGIPHVIVYKTSAISYALMKHFLVVTHIGLPNIVANETVAPELIQEYVTESTIVAQLERFITSEQVYRETAQKLLSVRALLGSKKPSVSVADSIESVLQKS